MNDLLEDYLEEDREIEDYLINTTPTQERRSFLMVPLEMYRNPLFRVWECTKRAGTAKYLYSYVLRKSMGYPMLDHIFNKYYEEKHLLVARFTQQRLASELEYKGRQGINNHMVQLRREGIYKVHFEPWRGRTIRIYEFGTWEMYKGRKIETLLMFSKFEREFCELDKKKFYEK